MSNGPVPSRLTFLSSLPDFALGDKVRFLGCVDGYTAKTATLVLRHAYPKSNAAEVVAHVNVDHVLETMKQPDTQIGTWLNVMGYVTEAPEQGRNALRATRPRSKQVDERIVHVQAIVLWQAGSVGVDKYETALEARLNSGT